LPPLAAAARARLPDASFAYVDSKGNRRLPIHDVSHVRNALARFDQVVFEDDVARERARERLLRAAKRYGIVPLGFFDGQLRKERLHAELLARGTKVRSLPRGTVTFLFTDIEDSTGLIRKLGDAYAKVLREVRTMIRTCVREAEGHEVDARADEFFAVFDQPAPAVNAAVAIQRAVLKRRWPKKARVCLRIGVHSGRPKLSETGYVGIAVHTAARVCSAGHGGQILVSYATRSALGDVEQMVLRDLGRHPLQGLPEPESLFQIEAEGLQLEFPRLRTNNAVPAQVTQ
jgi:class 3 adenylate cyclase